MPIPAGSIRFTFDQVMAQVDPLVHEVLWWPVREPELAGVERA